MSERLWPLPKFFVAWPRVDRRKISRRFSLIVLCRQNQRTWLYRCLPSVVHKPFEPFPEEVHITSDASKCIVTPRQLRWKATPIPHVQTNFIHGLHTMCCAGSPSMKDGYAIHVYAITASMLDSCMCNADGDFLFVPQEGKPSVYEPRWNSPALRPTTHLPP